MATEAQILSREMAYAYLTGTTIANLACRGVASGEAGPLYNCRESSTNQPFYAKQTQFQEKSNERKSI